MSLRRHLYMALEDKPPNMTHILVEAPAEGRSCTQHQLQGSLHVKPGPPWCCRVSHEVEAVLLQVDHALLWALCKACIIHERCGAGVSTWRGEGEQNNLKK